MLTAAELQKKIPNLGFSAVASEEHGNLVVRIRPWAGAPNEMIVVERTMVRGLKDAEARPAIYTSTTKVTAMSPEAVPRFALAVALAAEVVKILIKDIGQ